jgi:hypothetical protein
MDRWVIDLETARDNTPYNIHKWKYLHVGDCTGDVTIRLGSPSSSALNPDEFDALGDVINFHYLYITVKRDIDNFKVVDGKLSAPEQPKMKRIGEKLFFSPDTTVNPTIYLKDGEKIMVNTDTKEVRIK